MKAWLNKQRRNRKMCGNDQGDGEIEQVTQVELTMIPILCPLDLTEEYPDIRQAILVCVWEHVCKTEHQNNQMGK